MYSMSSICTQEAWPEVMSKTMRLAPHQLTPLVNYYSSNVLKETWKIIYA
jgi:hypothetical protein